MAPRAVGLVAAVLATASGCFEDASPGSSGPELEPAIERELPESLSPDAKVDTWASLRDDLDAPRHPSDGGGRAWLEEALSLADDGSGFAPAAPGPSGRPRLRVGSRGRFHLVYEAGELGIAEGGAVFLQISPFWDWDSPQTHSPQYTGYTTVRSDAEGVDLEAFGAGPQLLVVELKERGLEAGERIEIVFGAGPSGARVDRYAEAASQLFFAVDGDGDGVRALVPDPPAVEVGPAEPARIIVTLPTTARPGARVDCTVAVLDALGNAGTEPSASVRLELVGARAAAPAKVAFVPGDRGRRRVTLTVAEEGVLRVRAVGEGALAGLAGESNPLIVRADARPILWADLHGHSHLSDGTGTPEDYFTYARDVAALDVVALTDHDHWGMRFLDASPAMWAEIRDATSRFHEPGVFVTLLGYEWTSWLHGHRHVLYFADDGPVLSSMDPRYERPDQLWAALAGEPALTFAHHSAGGPVATNWRFVPPPEIEPVTEIVSVHGSSESPDSPASIYAPVAGNFVRDALSAGYRFGFIGSSDSHDGHPGLAGLASGTGLAGLAAISAAEKTRPAVLEALRARRTWATNGPRIFLDVTLDGQPTGPVTARREGGPSVLDYEIVAPGAVERIDFVRTGLVASVEGGGLDHIRGTREIPPLAAGEFLYLRVVQEDDGAAWSSPFYGSIPAEGSIPAAGSLPR